MINDKENPVEWALLMYDLSDVQEHVKSLLDQMVEDGQCSEEDFAVQVGHLYAHLNRVWNSRRHIGEIDDAHFLAYSQFPTDIDHVG
jgi:hypothetical protein